MQGHRTEALRTDSGVSRGGAWVKLAELNSGSGFAGHTDWRVPNRFELESLLNLGTSYPAVSPAFNTACAPACTVLTCSCTAASFYWSSTTVASSPSIAWVVGFSDGYANFRAKGDGAYVRAVRGGS